jgi:ribosomal protein S6
MKNYELICLLPPILSEKDVAETSEQIKKMISEQSGILQKELKPAKKRFGYQIKQYREGFLLSFLFCLKPDSLSLLEKELKEQKNVLRFMSLTRNPLFKKKEEKQFSSAPEKENQKKKVGLKEIDKKINEILKE